MNPNNCNTCEHKVNPDGGWCYMFREEPTAVCHKHAARAGSYTTLDVAPSSDLVDVSLDVLTNLPVHAAKTTTEIFKSGGAGDAAGGGASGDWGIGEMLSTAASAVAESASTTVGAIADGVCTAADAAGDIVSGIADAAGSIDF